MQKSAYFVDFDFTISQSDVWDAIVRYSDADAWKDVVGQYVRGEISSRIYNTRVAALVPPKKEAISQLVLEIGIDPTFPDFVQWLHNHDFPITIVSDGYDFYIDLLLKQAGLDCLPYFSNRMVWTEQGIEVEFPLYKKNCEKDMAHCKCQHFENFPNLRHVYIGDGVSDICAATKCDTIYAKRNLLEYCQREHVPHTPFENYHQIMEAEENRVVGSVG
jgi:2-hydroxy-3-keto-5-methylthiopentenyl-1-phosphate phosphatase